MKYIVFLLPAIGVALIADSGPSDVMQYVGFALIGVYAGIAWRKER